MIRQQRARSNPQPPDRQAPAVAEQLQSPASLPCDSVTSLPGACSDAPAQDPSLATVTASWTALPAHIKAAIMALVSTASANARGAEDAK